jgi:glycosyltransferase involved in cell wall biosynthesis
MKITLLMSVASPQSRDIAVQICGLGHVLHIVDAVNLDSISYLSPNDPYQQESIRNLEGMVKGVHRCAYSGLWGAGALGLAGRLSRILRDSRPDILLTIHGGAYAAAAYLSGFRPYAIYIGGSDVLSARHLKKFFSRVSLTAASLVFSNGGYLAQKTQDLAPRANVIPLYMGTDTMKFRPGNRPASPISIVCTRGFMPIYNNELLIRALAYLPEDLLEHEVVFAAAGPQLESARSLAGQILTPNQRSRVKFLGGASRDLLAELLSRAHIYVSVSRSDGTSISLLEALASGAFPVLSEIPANQEWIQPELENGLLVPCDDAPELARALARVIKDEKLRSAASLMNRKLILERADLKSNMATMLRELARCKGAGPLPMETATASRVQE